MKKKGKRRARWIAVALVVLCLSLLGAQTSLTQDLSPQAQGPVAQELDLQLGFGDIPLDAETYQKYLKRLPRAAVDALPAAYDARDDGIVTPAEHQGGCGSCWAFASTGAFESHLLKEHSFGPSDLSEQQILSCNISGYDCAGGSLHAPKFWQTVGPVYDTCFPYTADDTTPCSDGAACAQLPYRVTGWHTVASDQFKASLYSDGPSYWRFDAYQDFKDFWNTTGSAGDVYTNADTDEGNDFLGGHAVLIIGWDDGKGAYLCKNSWGVSGGPEGDGTFWIAYSGHHNDLSFQMSNFNLDSLNDPPVADANGPYEGDEGESISFDGAGSSDPDGDPLTYEWTFGDGDTATGATPSHTYDDDDVYSVCLTVSDGWLEDTDCTYADIDNVAPTATFSYPAEVDEGSTFDLSLTDAYDPSSVDTAAGFLYAFDCGDGYDPWSITSGTSCQTYDDGILDVKAKIQDKDGGETEYTAQVTVNNLPPQVTIDTETQTIQYSDYICPVLVTATDVAQDALTPSVTLPDSLALVSLGCVPSSDGIWHTCTWRLQGTIDQSEGDYLITITVEDEDGGSAPVDTTVIVEPEDADIWLEDDNPVAVKVDAPGGDSPLFTLTAYVQEILPDAAVCGADPGDIDDAQVSITLVPVGPGSPVTELCTNAGVTGTGHDAVLTAECGFHDLLVNIYHVQATVTGGYYTNGLVEDVLVVYDPSLGFTTGAGWFYWPGTADAASGYPGEKTNFGYVMKHNKKGNNVHGNLLLIRHRADGSIYRLKSNALFGLALGAFDVDDVTVGWASFAGKATYREPGWAAPTGNHRFIMYVEDWNEPGAGHDQMWIEVQDKKEAIIPAMSMDRPAVANTVTLGGGNIVVPHQGDE
jgi:C1A family cysteine protease